MHVPAQQQVRAWTAHQHVGKFPTELIGVQATQTPTTQLLVVPGNPGYAGFYTDFMQQLHHSFDGAADVLAVSHVGHDAEDISRGAVWGLGCQVQHKAQLVRELTAPGRPPLVILAHSIGAYIMLQVCVDTWSTGQDRTQSKSHRTGNSPPVCACVCSSWQCTHAGACILCCVLVQALKQLNAEGQRSSLQQVTKVSW